MLFGYLIDPSPENWLHDCLYEILKSIHDSLKTGNLLPVWPEIIPEKHRQKLQKRRGLKEKLITYQTNLRQLTIAEQDQILDTLNEQNNISQLLSCQQVDCKTIDDLPLAIREPIEDLFKFAFDLLGILEIRDQHYHKIYNMIPSHVCPFCGYEKFSSPRIGSKQGEEIESKREDLDHYLLKKSYPFAGANLYNLIPMGHKCNSRYKHEKNILYKKDGTRRKAFDPYNHKQTIRLSLDRSQLFEGNSLENGKAPLPKWEIEFIPHSDEIDTWDDVFKIRDRYIGDQLNAEFSSWLNYFGKRCQLRNISTSYQDVLNEINLYVQELDIEGFANEAFLKIAVFRMISFHYQQGNQRLINLIRDCVLGVNV